MDKRLTRQLASVFLVAAIILIGIKNIHPKKEATAAPKAGFIEVKQSDYKNLKQESEQWKQKYEELNKKKTEEKEKSVVKVMHININKGMTSKDVGKKLEKAEIIQDANELNNYLAKKDWQESIQIGDYELTSNMDLPEIAKIITGNHSKKR